MSLSQFLRILWARRLLIGACTVFTFIGAVLVILLVPPRYEAKSRVIIAALLRPDPLSITDRDNTFRDVESYANTQRELVLDYRVTGDVAEKLGWTSDPRWIDRYQARPSSDTRDFRRWLADRVASQTKVDFVAGTIMEISFSSPSPVEARIGAETLRTSYINYSLTSKQADAARSAEWYKGQAEAARKSAEEAENRKAKFERENGIVMTGRGGNDSSDLDSEQLAAMASAAVAAPAAQAPAAFSPSSIQLAQVDAQIAEQAGKLGPNHPQMQALRAQRSSLAAMVSQERAAARQMSSGAGQVAAVGRALQEQKARVLGQREKIEVARQMAAEVDLKREQYRATATKAAQLALEAGVKDSGMSPLGTVVAPDSPAFPNRPLVIIGSIGLGIAFGLLLAVLVELMNRRVRGVEDLHHEDGLECLAVVSSARPREARRSAQFLTGRGRRLQPAQVA